jgi:DNA-binding IclR family transcriptional regulator
MEPTISDGPETTGPVTSGTRIQSVARACQLLIWLAEKREGATAKEVALAHRLTLPTTYHLLNTLVDQGLLAKHTERRFVLGHGSGIVARGYVRASAVPESYVSAMRALATRTQEVVSLADWCELDVRILASVERNNVVRVAEMMNTPYEDAHARANGKLLLAYAAPDFRDAYIAAHPPRRRTQATICDLSTLERELARIRKQGYASDDQEFARGLSCVAAPILENGALIASIAVSSTSERFAEKRDELTGCVLEATRGIRAGAFG